MASDWIGATVARLVHASCERATVVIVLVAILTFLSVAYTREHFAINSDSLALISPDVAWRRNQAAFDRAFPQLDVSIVVVIDGATPELAEGAAASLAAKLAQRSESFASVRRPDAGPFFTREGLLFLSRAELDTNTTQLIGAQPFLGPIAADPSLRGVTATLSNALLGVSHGDTKLATFDRPFQAVADAISAVLQGKPAIFSWRELISNQAPTLRETRRFILVEPKLDFTKLLAAGTATDVIRQTVRDLGLMREGGVTVRMTGQAVLADDEFATIAERAWLMSGVMIAGVLLMLWFAVRSIRVIACIMSTTLVGLAITTCLGLLTFGTFSVISVGFVSLFVGLGIDFAIQFSVRYRAERLLQTNLRGALIEAGRKVGGSLALAAAATAIGFFAFLPTSYVGAAELGLIAGMGMVVAFVLAITFLPALLTVVRPAGESEAVGFAALAPVDRFLVKRRRLVLATAAAAALVSLVSLPWLRFDFNPFHLRSTKVESVATLADLMSDSDHTPNTINIIAPSLTAADALAQRLSALPEVERATTLTSFIPKDQPDKLAMIENAAMLLDSVFTPLDSKPPPSDRETIESLRATAAALRQAAGTGHDETADRANRLASVLSELAAAPKADRDRASRVLIDPFRILIAQLHDLLQANPVTRQTMPADLVRDWLTPDGRARINVVPRGDSNDNRTLRRFAGAVLAVAPEATGPPVTTQEAARMMVNAFAHAGLWSFLGIVALLLLVLHRVQDVVLTMVPIFLTGLLTLATCVFAGEALDFANIIALPLLFGVGVAFNIYFVIAWRMGETKPLQSSLARAVLFSALTTGTAFGTLSLSTHPGTAGTGRLLIISIGWTLIVALLFEPALLGPPRR
jgi:hopanoid biosynthesis associated RND transporter like protein HpnN